MPWQGIPLEEAMPECERGDTFTVDEIKLVEKQTSPPDYLTEAELITLMEKHGVGKQEYCLLDTFAVYVSDWKYKRENNQDIVLDSCLKRMNTIWSSVFKHKLFRWNQ